MMNTSTYSHVEINQVCHFHLLHRLEQTSNYRRIVIHVELDLSSLISMVWHKLSLVWVSPMEHMHSSPVEYEYSNVVVSCQSGDVYSFDVTRQLHQHFSFDSGLTQWVYLWNSIHWNDATDEAMSKIIRKQVFCFESLLISFFYQIKVIIILNRTHTLNKCVS